VFLAWPDYGRGRVVYLGAPLTYQLRYRQGDRYHHRFWGQLLRWAIAPEMGSGSRTVHLSTDKARYSRGQSVQVMAQLCRPAGQAVSGAQCRVVAHQQDRVVASVDLAEDAEAPGVYRGQLQGLPVGPVALEVAGAQVQSLLAEEGYTRPVQAIIAMDPAESLELRNTRCNLPLLTQLAQASGGTIVPPTALEAALGDLDLAPRTWQSVSRQPLWTRWAYLWLFLGCAALEWLIRKLVGMA
jgi:hypothetical protein